MPLPDVVVNVKSAAISRTLPSGTGVGFAAGVTQRGSTAKARLLRSLQDFVDYCGARLASSLLYDAVETFFGEGGVALYVGRVFGAGAAQAQVTLYDAGGTSSGNASLVVKAGSLGDPDPGTWGNSLKAEVVAATGGYQINIYLSNVLVESSPTLVTQADAVAWSSTSRYVVVTLGASTNVPTTVAATSLTGGTDGSAVGDADYALGLGLFTKELGPGQVFAPGRTSNAGALQLLAHAVANNRFALIDLPDTPTASTLTSAAQALYTAPNNGRRWGQPAAPWDLIPSLTAGGAMRAVPPSARLAAQYARVDALGNPNQAAAGRFGVAQFALDLSQPAWSDSDRKALNEAGVTVSRRRYGNAVATWGMRTLADQVNDAQWSMAPNVRCVMAYVASATVIGDSHEFDQVDANGHTLSRWRGELIDAANSLYSVGALFGATPGEAFKVDTGVPGGPLNSLADLAAGKMHAQVSLRTSPSAEVVTIDVVKTPITQALA